MGILHQQIIMLITTPLYVIIIGVEIFLSQIQHTRSYSWRETLHNFCLSLLGGGVELVMRGVSFGILVFFFSQRLFTIEHSFLYWAGLLFLVDFMHYWLHRLGHSCRLIWAVHCNHHSSEHFNFTVGFRAGVLEPLYRFIFFIPLAWAGFQPVDILLMYSITEIWSILTHTEKVKKLGWLEYIFVTPSHHRVHHASNVLYLDRNMGTMFIFWDKLFGTFQRELPAAQYEPLRYGLTSSLEKETLPGIIFFEWKNLMKDLKRKDLSLKQKWQYLVKPPGWSHDGSRLTSDQMREQEGINRITIT